LKDPGPGSKGKHEESVIGSGRYNRKKAAQRTCNGAAERPEEKEGSIGGNGLRQHGIAKLSLTKGLLKKIPQ